MYGDLYQRPSARLWKKWQRCGDRESEERSVPTVGEAINEEITRSVVPVYGVNNAASTEKYEAIAEENKKLMTGTDTYDELDADGKLYLNGAETGNVLYKHPFSVGLYGGDISDTEKTVIKTIEINPISLTNYITGLYAPAGEVIKIEFGNGDLERIGGYLQFIIGQVNQDGGGSDNRKDTLVSLILQDIIIIV